MSEKDIYDSFDFDDNDDSENYPDEGSCVLQFATESVKINLGDPESPKTLEAAFKQYAQALGTSSDVNPIFRTTEPVPGTTELRPMTTYLASVEAAKHG